MIGRLGVRRATSVKPAFRKVEAAPVQSALEALDERKRNIVRLRFFEGRSQQEVADRLGLSQMHISRLERSALRQLREVMTPA